ncbi:hypothetical protein JTB14_000703, partial [Gonioctena quinquepunctata]
KRRPSRGRGNERKPFRQETHVGPPTKERTKSEADEIFATLQGSGNATPDAVVDGDKTHDSFGLMDEDLNKSEIFELWSDKTTKPAGTACMDKEEIIWVDLEDEKEQPDKKRKRQASPRKKGSPDTEANRVHRTVDKLLRKAAQLTAMIQKSASTKAELKAISRGIEEEAKELKRSSDLLKDWRDITFPDEPQYLPDGKKHSVKVQTDMEAPEAPAAGTSQLTKIAFQRWKDLEACMNLKKALNGQVTLRTRKLGLEQTESINLRGIASDITKEEIIEVIRRETGAWNDEHKIDRVMQHARDGGGEVIICGDFDVKSGRWHSITSDRRGEYLVEWIESMDLIVINGGDTLTFSRRNQKSIIDVTLASSTTVNNIRGLFADTKESLHR